MGNFRVSKEHGGGIGVLWQPRVTLLTRKNPWGASDKRTALEID